MTNTALREFLFVIYIFFLSRMFKGGFFLEVSIPKKLKSDQVALQEDTAAVYAM